MFYYREKKNSITISNLRRLIQSVQTVLLCVSICSENSICAPRVYREKKNSKLKNGPGGGGLNQRDVLFVVSNTT